MLKRSRRNHIRNSRFDEEEAVFYGMVFHAEKVLHTGYRLHDWDHISVHFLEPRISKIQTRFIFLKRS